MVKGRNSFIQIAIYAFVVLTACRSNKVIRENQYWNDGSLKVLVENIQLGNYLLIANKHYNKGVFDTSNYYQINQFYSNGNIESIGYLKNGLKDSTWKYWYDSGILSMEATYKQGKLYGVLRTWLPDGSASETLEYRNDSIVE